VSAVLSTQAAQPAHEAVTDGWSPAVAFAYAREALLLDLSIDLATLLQFAGSVFAALRAANHHDAPVLGGQALQFRLDLHWLTEFLHDVQRVTTPLAQGQYERAAHAAGLLARHLAVLCGLADDGTPADHPWVPERLEVQAMLRRWGRTFSPALPETVDVLRHVAQTCTGLAASYAARSD
jgi:hypothetical protein